MKWDPKRALVAEFYNAHLETLYPQVFYLEASGHTVWVAVQDTYAVAVQNHLPGRTVIALPTKGFSARWLAPWKVLRTLWRHRIPKLAVNTLTSNLGRRLTFGLWWLPRVQPAAVLHSSNRLRPRLSQRIIQTRFRRYWLLSAHQHEHLPVRPTRSQIGTLWPVVLEDPQSPGAGLQPLSSISEEATVRIAIPGHANRQRRDYQALFGALEKRQPKPGEVLFFLLGDYSAQDGPDILQEIQDRELTHYFRWYTHRLPQYDFNQQVRACHAILPLLHPGQAGYEKYQTVKTSGSLNLAPALGLPMLVPQGFLMDKEIQPWVIRYPLESFSQMRWLLILPKPTATWDVEASREQYLRVWG
ncbi:MAG: hypothetical protein AAFQ98_06520 [Bacteroidota bacterium]